MRNILVVFVASLALVACATDSAEFKPTSTVRVVNSTSYPEFPNIEPLPPVDVLPWKHDVPRDMTVFSVKNTTVCRKVETYTPEDKPYVVLPKEQQTEEWWSKCGEHPPLPDSNIFIGFSQDQWNILIENFAKLRERVWQYKQRIDQVNKQRDDWRKKADEERMRIEKQNSGDTSSNPEAPKQTEDTKKSGFFGVFGK